MYSFRADPFCEAREVLEARERPRLKLGRGRKLSFERENRGVKARTVFWGGFATNEYPVEICTKIGW